MTVQEIMESYGICGLVCALCSYNIQCAGCRCKDGDCDIKSCCLEKGLSHCFLCDEFPCDKGMHKNTRIRAFNTIAKNEGLQKLAEYLYNNYTRGIYYHRPDGLTGDYDRCKTETEIIELLKNGKPNPYDICPSYESKNFILRMVTIDDAADLLECYSDPEAAKYFNSDRCSSDFHYSTIDEMRECIRFWFNEYEKKIYVRLSVIDKQTEKAVGTVEINVNELGIMRIDIMSEYEKEEYLSELLKIADSFFYDFKCERIIIKAVPEAITRISSLTENGYNPYPANSEWNWEHYYIKNRP